MENRSLSYFFEVKKKHSSRVKSMKSLRNKESVTRCTSQEKLSNLINQYESQLDKTKKLKKLLVNKSKKIQFP